MKKLLVTCLSILTLPAMAQNKLRPHEAHLPTSKINKYNCKCVHRNTYTASQRLKFYPFNKAMHIKLVSYNGEPEPNLLVKTIVDPVNNTVRYDTISRKVKWKYPFEGKKVDTLQFMKTVTLNRIQINNLTDMLFNIDERKHNHKVAYGEFSCFEPRNAILFTDSTGKAFAYIQICFECQKVKTYPETVNWGGFCIEKLDIIKQYFASVGIKYGITTMKMP